MANIEIKINTIVDKAIADIKKAAGAVDNLGDSAKKSSQGAIDFSSAMTGLNQALEVAEKVMRAVKMVHDETVGVFIEYAAQVRDMSRATGESAEQSSRMIQMADDVGIAYDQLKTSLQMAARQGIDVSVESLKALSEEYLTLAPGTERMQFLLERFGRSGADMGRLMEMGAAGINKLNAGIEGGLILSDAILKQARANEILVGTYKDLIEARKIAAGATLSEAESTVMMEGLIQAQLELMQAEQEALDDSNMGHWEAATFKAAHRAEAEQLVQTMINEKQAAEESAGAVAGLAAAEEAAAGALDEVATAQKGLEAAQKGWLATTANEVASALGTLGVKGQAYKDALVVIDEVMGTQKVAEQAHKDAIKEITDQYKKTGDIEGFRTALAGLKDTELPQTTDALEAARKKAADLNTQLENLREQAAKPIVLNVVWNVTGSAPAGTGGSTLNEINPMGNQT